MYAVGARERVLGWIWRQLGLEVVARGGGQKWWPEVLGIGIHILYGSAGKVVVWKSAKAGSKRLGKFQ